MSLVLIITASTSSTLSYPVSRAEEESEPSRLDLRDTCKSVNVGHAIDMGCVCDAQTHIADKDNRILSEPPDRMAPVDKAFSDCSSVRNRDCSSQAFQSGQNRLAWIVGARYTLCH